MDDATKQLMKLQKELREIDKLKAQTAPLQPNQIAKVNQEPELLAALAALQEAANSCVPSTGGPSASDEAMYFLAIGDWGYPSLDMKTVSAEMAQRANETRPRLVLALGDNFYPRGVRSVKDAQFKTSWMDVFLCHQALCIPWKVCLGNHDYMGEPKVQIAFTGSDQNPRGKDGHGIWQCEAQNYNFSCSLPGGRSIEFFALDTNGCQGHVRRKYPHMEQELHSFIEELDHKLHASKATWKVVFGHHPMYTKGAEHGTIARCLKDSEYTYASRGMYREYVTAAGYGLESVLVRHGVHAYFSGHEHCFQAHFCGGVGHFVCGASGAEHMHFHGGEDLSQQCNHPEFVDLDFHCGFADVAVTSSTMIVSFISSKGIPIYQARCDLEGGWSKILPS